MLSVTTTIRMRQSNRVTLLVACLAFLRLVVTYILVVLLIIPPLTVRMFVLSS